MKIIMLKGSYSLLLPNGLLDYFRILKVDEQTTQLRIYLEEKNNLEDSLGDNKVFCEKSLINIFPIREKSLLLSIRRRRWINKETGEYFNRDFNLVAQGTRITEEFVAYLKGLHR